MVVELDPIESDRPSGQHNGAWFLIAGLAVIGAAVLVISIAYSDDEASESLPTTAVQRTTAPTAQPGRVGAVPQGRGDAAFVPLSDVLPDLFGTLHAVVGGDPFVWVTWESDPGADNTRLRLPAGWPFGFGFDAAGERFAFATHGPSEQGRYALHLRHPSGSITELVSPVTSFAWHQTEPATIAAVTVHARGRAQLAKFSFEDRFGSRTNVTDVPPEARIVAWGDWGFLLHHYDPLLDGHMTSLLDIAGGMVWQRSGRVLATAPATGGTVLERGGADGSREFFLIKPDTPDLEPGTVLQLPNEITGIGWSSNGQQLGVASHVEGGSWRLTIFDREEELATTVPFAWQVWDVQWSPDDRFVLMPGTDNGSTHAVLFYDTATGNLTPIEFETWVQWAAVVE